jgi:hypothetical protein
MPEILDYSFVIAFDINRLEQTTYFYIFDPFPDNTATQFIDIKIYSTALKSCLTEMVPGTFLFPPGKRCLAPF